MNFINSFYHTFLSKFQKKVKSPKIEKKWLPKEAIYEKKKTRVRVCDVFDKVDKKVQNGGPIPQSHPREHFSKWNEKVKKRDGDGSTCTKDRPIFLTFISLPVQRALFTLVNSSSHFFYFYIFFMTLILGQNGKRGSKKCTF